MTEERYNELEKGPHFGIFTVENGVTRKRWGLSPNVPISDEENIEFDRLNHQKLGIPFCSLSNEELIEKVLDLTNQMYRNNEIPIIQIPLNPDEDYNFLIGKLCERFKHKIKYS